MVVFQIPALTARQGKGDLHRDRPPEWLMAPWAQGGRSRTGTGYDASPGLRAREGDPRTRLDLRRPVDDAGPGDDASVRAWPAGKAEWRKLKREGVGYLAASESQQRIRQSACQRRLKQSRGISLDDGPQREAGSAHGRAKVPSFGPWIRDLRCHPCKVSTFHKILSVSPQPVENTMAKIRR